MKTINSYNPATGELIGTVDVTPVEKINEYVRKSAEAQRKWAELSIDRRIEYLIEAGQALLNKSEEISELLSMEMGKSLGRSMGEVAGSARSIEYVSAQVKRALEPVVYETRKRRTVIKYEPLGVCGIISP